MLNGGMHGEFVMWTTALMRAADWATPFMGWPT